MTDFSFNNVTVVGLGYIGLPTAAIMAAHGHRVIGLDVKEAVVNTINQGEIHIVEPGLPGLVKSAVLSGHLRAVTRAEPSDAFMIAVPTPIKTDKTSDISYILSAIEEIAPVLKAGDLIVLESTSPVGTTEKMATRLSDLRPDLNIPAYGDPTEGDVHIAYCPERVLPGKVIEELVNNDRSIGGLTQASTSAAIALYKTFVKGELIATDARSAELCKLAENAYRDVSIAYANELANVCDRLNMNVWEVIRLANRHPRVNILQPGPGVGGHCIAVDPWFIAESAPEETPLIQSARHVNDGRPERIAEQVVSAAKALDQSRPTVALLGLAFKPNIDDLRESPAVDVALNLAALRAFDILAVEPHISELPPKLADAGLSLASIDQAKQADIVVLLVDHQAFKDLPADSFKATPMVDTRGLWVH
jgi:UDP-N-acetyl-D-mannosaminuronic acid dehydrogenase